MTNIIELPETANSPEAWRRQIAEVCERDGGSSSQPSVRETMKNDRPRLYKIIRRNFTVTAENCADICAGIRLYLGMHPEDPIDTWALMEGK
jgi:uncharacterized protein YutE (UPF0331/DUF86 family)